MAVFIHRGPLPPDSSLFYNRVDELANLRRLCIGKVKAYAMICGGRQNGKTSLLIRLANELPSYIQICRIDFQILSGANTAQVCTHIFQRISKALSVLGRTDEVSSFSELTELISGILEQASTGRLVLIFEELSVLPSITQRDLANCLRAMFNFRFDPNYVSLNKLMVIIAGGIELFELAVSEVSPLYNICEEIHLPNLRQNDAIQLVVNGLGQLGVEQSEADKIGNDLYKVVEGHPYLTQRIAGSIEAHLANASQEFPIDVTHFASEIYLDDPLFRHLARAINERDLKYAVQTLMSSNVRFSRLDQAMVQLELLGIAIRRDGFWRPRNQLLLKVLDFLGDHKITEDKKESTGRTLPPYSYEHAACHLEIFYHHSSTINIHGRGALQISSTTKNLLQLDPIEFSHHISEIVQGDWRFQSKTTGRQIYERVFQHHPELLSHYKQSLGIASNDESVHLHFISEREYLRIPLEFLHEGLAQGREYFVLQHPISRSIADMPLRKAPISPNFLNELWQSNEPLRVLLIGSNTYPNIPGVDAEIDELSNIIEKTFSEVNMRVSVHTLTSNEATYDIIRTELRRCSYHILHYAGHGSFDKVNPEKSHLLFWNEPGCSGEIRHLTVNDLKMLLRNSQLRFVYLSCCDGATTGSSTQLIDHDFLGIADGLVAAGIPSILSYRWPVSDSSAKIMAHTFYQSLAQHGELDIALLDARGEVAAIDRDDISWLSPILIMQT